MTNEQHAKLTALLPRALDIIAENMSHPDGNVRAAAAHTVVSHFLPPAPTPVEVKVEEGPITIQEPAAPVVQQAAAPVVTVAQPVAAPEEKLAPAEVAALAAAEPAAT
jgi:hypothetical protein